MMYFRIFWNIKGGDINRSYHRELAGLAVKVGRNFLKNQQNFRKGLKNCEKKFQNHYYFGNDSPAFYSIWKWLYSGREAL